MELILSALKRDRKNFRALVLGWRGWIRQRELLLDEGILVDSPEIPSPFLVLAEELTHKGLPLPRQLRVEGDSEFVDFLAELPLVLVLEVLKFFLLLPLLLEHLPVSGGTLRLRDELLPKSPDTRLWLRQHGLLLGRELAPVKLLVQCLATAYKV